VLVDVTYSPIAFWKWHLQNTMRSQEVRKQALGMGGDDKEVDMIRDLLLDTSPWLLGLTAVVSLLHSLFDFLAFKNDVQVDILRTRLMHESLIAIILNVCSSGGRGRT
jgi:Cleft lip and palate transmembrane protein 1 (CLPTM1)